MKKKLAILLICTGICSSLCACSSKDAVVAVDESSDVAATTVEEETTTQGDTQNDSEWEQITECKFDYSMHDTSFFNQDFAITVGYSGEIRYTNNGGKSWTNAENSTACLFGLDIINENTSIACGNYGNVTKSTDGGKNFEKKTNYGASAPLECMMMNFVDENTGIIASKKIMGLTTDGGDNWTDLSLPDGVNIAAIRMVDANTFYFIGNNFKMYKTADAGVTWEETDMNLLEGTDYLTEGRNFAFAVDGENAFTVYCFTSSNELKSYSTTDNFASLVENVMPKVSMNSHLNLNNAGNLLTINDTFGAGCLVLAHK